MSFHVNTRKRIITILITILIMGLSGVLDVYAGNSNTLIFSPSTITPRLNCSNVTSDIVLDFDGISTYGADVWRIWDTNKYYIAPHSYSPDFDIPSVGNDCVIESTFGDPFDRDSQTQFVYQRAGYLDSTSYCQNTVVTRDFDDAAIGRVQVSNTGSEFVTGLTVYFYTGATTQTFVTSGNGGGAQEINASNGLSITNLTVNYSPHPCRDDDKRPQITLTNFPTDDTTKIQPSDMTNNVRTLVDHSTNDGGTEYSGNHFTSIPDYTNGTNFLPSPGNTTAELESSVGVDSGTRSMSFAITDGRDDGSFDSENTTTFSYTSGGLTWNHYDRNPFYELKNASGTVSIGSIPAFPIEERVTITMTVKDKATYGGTLTGGQYTRTAQTHTVTRTFNQGLDPRANPTTSGTTTSNYTCEFTTTEYQTGVKVDSFTIHLHDDRAGIDTGNVDVIFSGYAGNNTVSETFNLSNNTDTYGQSPVVSFDQFDYPGSWSRADNDGTTVTLPAGKTSTGNYTVTVNNTRIRDPEDRVDVTISYQDLVGRTGTNVTCYHSSGVQPKFSAFSGDNGGTTWNSLFVLRNHPFGAQITGFTLQLQDDRAGVNSGTISVTISGNTLNSTQTDVVATGTFYAGSQLFHLLTQINGGTLRTLSPVYNVYAWNLINYSLYFDQTDGTDSAFTGRFAPEYPVNITATFRDLDFDSAPNGSGKEVSNPIDQTYTNNEAPKLFTHDTTTGFDGATNLTQPHLVFSGSGGPTNGNQKIYPYTGEDMNTGVTDTDIAFRTTDNRAGINTSAVSITITGTQRGVTRTFTLSGSDLVFSAFNLNSRNSLNYLISKSDHGIYFDWQSYDTSGGVLDAQNYTITISASDLKKPVGSANTTSYSDTMTMENLQCTELSRCNAFLYFTYDYTSGANMPEPVVGTGIHPFDGRNLYVIGSGVLIDTGNHYIDCQGGGTLVSPINLTFTGGIHATGITSYNTYENSTLYIADGTFELTGGDTIILR